MILRKGNMFAEQPDVLIVTGNSTIKADGSLVMGRGAARQARDTFIGCDMEFGKLIREHLTQWGNTDYGFLKLPVQETPVLGLFQVKRHYLDRANLQLIDLSVTLLRLKINLSWRSARVIMNFPGIGNGHLTEEEVFPHIIKLPDNVEVWELP